MLLIIIIMAVMVIIGAYCLIVIAKRTDERNEIVLRNVKCAKEWPSSNWPDANARGILFRDNTKVSGGRLHRRPL